MAPKPEPRVAFFFVMALTLLAIMTWLSRDLAARSPPTQAIYQPQPVYQPQHPILY